MGQLLLQEDINKLINQGCVSENWDDISFENTDLDKIRNVTFYGKVKISDMTGELDYFSGRKISASISNVCLVDVTIKGSVLIRNVGGFIANYCIEEGVVIENVGSLYTEGKTRFGNGTEVSVVVESGGRTVKIFDKLSSHTAYLLSFYRQKDGMIRKIESLIDDYGNHKASTIGKIRNNVRISNTRLIKNTYIGSHATIKNADEIDEATIKSSQNNPSYVGNSVIVRESIVLEGGYLDDGVIVTRSFLGEGVKLTKQFSCHDSLLFANSEGQHGEACSLFAGPYTVTHHKSTLLIAGYFSFYNAGSGTNQSNHMYKLGPCHQGILERGCKTSSNCYLRFPCHIATFSTVIGSHYNLDASDFPFSRLVDRGNHRTEIMPSLNLFTVGISRDEFKWKNRDRRRGKVKDFLIFDVLNPYTVSKIVAAQEILKKMKQELEITSGWEDFIVHKNMYISKSRLDEYCSRYELAINFYLCNSLVSFLEKGEALSEFYSLMEENPWFQSLWIDVAGLIVTGHDLNTLREEIEKDKILDIQDLENKWEEFYQKYTHVEKKWIFSLLGESLNLDFSDPDKKFLRQILGKYDSLSKKVWNLFYEDAEKEFNFSSRIGFGLDWKEEKDLDFKFVRGDIFENSFISTYKEEMERRSLFVEDYLEKNRFKP